MNDYSDIIDLPHHVSKVHPQMSMLQRAAQFAPFAALTGHGAAIKEAAKISESQYDQPLSPESPESSDGYYDETI